MQNIDLYYLVCWDKIKEKTWSGTCYSLYKALLKYANVFDVPLLHKSLLRRLLKKLRAYDDFDIDFVKRNRQYCARILPDKDITVFQFTDIVDNDNNINTYIYQDMNVSYIRYLYYNNPKILNYSGYGNIPISIIEKRYHMETESLKKCAGIFTMGQWYRDYLIKSCSIAANKVFHVGGGINLDAHKIDYSMKQGNKILFVGRDFKRKGGYLVLEAFRLLKLKFPNCELHVAGPSKDPNTQYIDGYYYHGDCSKEELSTLFNRCDIFCMPSYYEAYGLVFIEALSYGLPCIGRNVYEMPYFINDGETGYLIMNDNPYELSDMMYKLLHNQDIINNVRNLKDFYLNEYSWDTVAKRIIKVISR